jgi:hypothetical protein
MIPIKIQCVCGQRYAFEVEPVDCRMPVAVKCPLCGTDGTEAANEVIAESVPARPAVAAVPAARPASRPNSYQLDPAKAEAEARSKVLWGDAPEEVTRFLMMQGLGYEDAAGLVSILVQERVAMLRGIGIRKVAFGIVLLAVPVVTFLIFRQIGYLPIRVFALTVMAGLYGAYLCMKGSFMLLAPKSEPGDVADK